MILIDILRAYTTCFANVTDAESIALAMLSRIISAKLGVPLKSLAVSHFVIMCPSVSTTEELCILSKIMLCRSSAVHRYV